MKWLTVVSATLLLSQTINSTKSYASKIECEFSFQFVLLFANEFSLFSLKPTSYEPKNISHATDSA